MSFFKKRVGFVNNCPMKPAVVNQPLIKFGMFNFAVSHSVCFLFFFFSKWEGKLDLWIFDGATQK